MNCIYSERFEFPHTAQKGYMWQEVQLLICISFQHKYLTQLLIEHLKSIGVKNSMKGENMNTYNIINFNLIFNLFIQHLMITVVA